MGPDQNRPEPSNGGRAPTNVPSHSTSSAPTVVVDDALVTRPYPTVSTEGAREDDACDETVPVVDVDGVVTQLLEALPSIGEKWAVHLDLWDGDPAGSYNDVAVMAHHLVDLLSTGQTDEAAQLFRLVEELLDQDPPTEVRTLLVIGLLEDIQNITSHEQRPIGSAAFVPLLGPVTATAWHGLHRSYGTQDT
jgi:hypothetical protein